MDGASQNVCILLAMYQGAEFLDDQLQSYVAQTHKNWSLIVSDDGSKDRSSAIARAFQKANPDKDIRIENGPRQGFATNFFSLLKRIPANGPIAALSDQDDVWFSDKLERGLCAISDHPDDVPVLYCSRTEVCDEALKPIGLSPLFERAPSFQNALVQSLGGGNTMMLNRAAIDLVQAVLAEKQPEVVAHDWWLYQVITGCGGVAIYDPVPSLLYRQHGGNLIGSNLSRLGKLNRAYLLFSGRFKTWNQINFRALSPISHLFKAAEKEVLDKFNLARSGSMLKRLKNLRKSGVYRQTKIGNIALIYACFLNRL